MSAQVNVQSTLSIADGSDLIRGSSQDGYTAYSGSYFGAVQNIGTSYEAINVYGMTQIKCLYVQNDSSASIDISQHPSSASFSTLSGSFPSVIYPPVGVVNYYAKSTEANSILKVVAAGY
jgi:hypothetical protein